MQSKASLLEGFPHLLWRLHPCTAVEWALADASDKPIWIQHGADTYPLAADRVGLVHAFSLGDPMGSSAGQIRYTYSLLTDLHVPQMPATSGRRPLQLGTPLTAHAQLRRHRAGRRRMHVVSRNSLQRSPQA